MLDKFLSLFERLVIAFEKQNQFFGGAAIMAPPPPQPAKPIVQTQPTAAEVEAKKQADVAQKQTQSLPAPNPFETQAAMPAISREEIGKALIALATGPKGRDAAIAVLLPFCPGKTATDDKLMDFVDPKNYGALLTAIQKASAA